MLTVVYAHDLNGSSQDAVAQALRHRGVALVAPDGRFRTLSRRIADLRAALVGRGPVILVGAGTGAVAAWCCAGEAPESVAALVLHRPDFGWVEPPNWEPACTTLPEVARSVLFHGPEPSSEVRSVIQRCRALAVELPAGDAGLVAFSAQFRGLCREVAAAHRPRRKAANAPAVPSNVPEDLRKPAELRVAPRLKRRANAPRLLRALRWPLVIVRPPDMPFPAERIFVSWRQVTWVDAETERGAVSLGKTVRGVGPCLLVAVGPAVKVAAEVARRERFVVRGALLLGPTADADLSVPVGVVVGLEDDALRREKAAALLRGRQDVTVNLVDGAAPYATADVQLRHALLALQPRCTILR